MESALLLIPQLGRKKYSINGERYGRNMLIGKYLWLAYCLSLPPGVEPDEENMRRGRKQVSSHIQVLKGFFSFHRCCKSSRLPLLPHSRSFNVEKSQADTFSQSITSSLPARNRERTTSGGVSRPSH
jgi:hypothetical protein